MNDSFILKGDFAYSADAKTLNTCESSCLICENGVYVAHWPSSDMDLSASQKSFEQNRQ